MLDVTNQKREKLMKLKRNTFSMSEMFFAQIDTECRTADVLMPTELCTKRSTQQNDKLQKKQKNAGESKNERKNETYKWQ